MSSNHIPRPEGYDKLFHLPVNMYLFNYAQPVHADMIHHQHVTLRYCRLSENLRS